MFETKVLGNRTSASVTDFLNLLQPAAKAMFAGHHGQGVPPLQKIEEFQYVGPNVLGIHHRAHNPFS